MVYQPLHGRVGLGDASQPAGKVNALRHLERDVVQAGGVLRARRVRLLGETQQITSTSAQGSERSLWARLAPVDFEPQDVGVERQHAVDAAHGEMHMIERGTGVNHSGPSTYAGHI